MIILNLKNYPEVMGEGSVRLARAAEKVATSTGVEIVVAPPGPMLALVASKVRVPVFSQSVGAETGDRTTGAFLPEGVRGSGARGTLLNHSESPKSASELGVIVPRLKELSLKVCLCAATAEQSVAVASLSPDYVAVEPPELIGSGVSVSRANPELVSRTVTTVRAAGFRGRVLCGAGIVTGDDVARAVELGADGVLVASSVVKAKDWEEKIAELAHSLR